MPENAAVVENALCSSSAECNMKTLQCDKHFKCSCYHIDYSIEMLLYPIETAQYSAKLAQASIEFARDAHIDVC